MILSIPAEDEERALTTIVPHTTSARGSRFEVEVKVNFLKSGVFDAQNILTIPHAKLVRKLGLLTSQHMADIEDAVCDWLGL